MTTRLWNSRLSVRSFGIGLFVLSLATLSESGFASAATRLATDQAQTEEQVKAKLARVLPSVHFDAAHLENVIDFFQDVTGVSISCNWKALEKARVSRDTPVSCQISNVQGGRALKIILIDVTGGSGPQLDYRIAGGKVHISTADNLKNHPPA